MSEVGEARGGTRTKTQKRKTLLFVLKTEGDPDCERVADTKDGVKPPYGKSINLWAGCKQA
jgi:hypothetical protein